MNKTKNPRKRYIYAFEFSDNHVYVGLTFSINKRKKQHLNKIYNNDQHNRSAVFIHINESSLAPEFKILTKNPLDELDASNMEIFYIEEYKKNGWVLLNRAKGGGLGGNNIIWTYEECAKEALKYNTRSEMYFSNASAYCSAIGNGWMDKISSHMLLTIRKPIGYWTKELVLEKALMYQRRREFKLNSGDAYSFAWKNGFLNEVCSHMIMIKPKGYWTFKNCQEEALKYNSRSEFKRKSSSAYGISYNNVWLDEVCKHMILISNPMYYWNFENCQTHALNYSNKTDFKHDCGGGYDSAREHGWLDLICVHMIEKKKKNGYWTIENCKIEALKYKFRSEFRKKSNHVYNISRNCGFMNEICSHMPIRKRRSKSL